MKQIKYFSILLIITSCASSTQMMLPNGEQGHYIECDESKSFCFKKAQEICPKGYKIFDNSSSVSSTPINDNTSITSIEHSMLIQCKKNE